MKRFLMMSVAVCAVLAWPWSIASGACTPAGQTNDEKAILQTLEAAIEGHNSENNDAIRKHVKPDLHTKRTDHQATGGTKTEETKSGDDYGQHNLADWKRFKDHKVTNCRVSNITVTGATAGLDVQYDFVFSKDNNPPDNDPSGSTVPMKGKLKYKKEGNAWLISDIDVWNTNQPQALSAPSKLKVLP